MSSLPESPELSTHYWRQQCLLGHDSEQKPGQALAVASTSLHKQGQCTIGNQCILHLQIPIAHLVLQPMCMPGMMQVQSCGLTADIWLCAKLQTGCSARHCHIETWSCLRCQIHLEVHRAHDKVFNFLHVSAGWSSQIRKIRCRYSHLLFLI